MITKATPLTNFPELQKWKDTGWVEMLHCLEEYKGKCENYNALDKLDLSLVTQMRIRTRLATCQLPATSQRDKSCSVQFYSPITQWAVAKP